MIVMGLDQHRGPITAEWIETETGEVRRARVAPAHREPVRRFLGRFRGEQLGWRWRRRQKQSGSRRSPAKRCPRTPSHGRNLSRTPARRRGGRQQDVFSVVGSSGHCCREPQVAHRRAGDPDRQPGELPFPGGMGAAEA
jgi:hypothetical protein